MSPLLLLLLQVMAGTDCAVPRPAPLADRYYAAVVKVPAFFVREPCFATPSPRVDVFAGPVAERKVAELRWVTDGRYCQPMVFVAPYRCPRGTLPVIEDGYEESALVMLRRRGDCVEVRLDRGSGWIRLGKNDQIRSYGDLVLERLAAFTNDWDGRLYRSPGKGMRRLQAHRQNVTVTDWQEVGGRLWFEVHVLDQSPCDARHPKDVAVGWVRAYSDRNQPTVAHFSRGC